MPSDADLEMGDIQYPQLSDFEKSSYAMSFDPEES
jgi:hypothetical protein